MERVFVGLGTNIEPREERLLKAREELYALPGVSPVAESKVYEAEPWGVTDQPMFLNQVVEIRCACEPEELLRQLKELERLLGRESRRRWGPREVDLDILAFGRRRIDTTDLTIPHAELARRAFVLGPWRDIAPDWRHPVTGKTIEDLWEALANEQKTIRPHAVSSGTGREQA